MAISEIKIMPQALDPSNESAHLWIMGLVATSPVVTGACSMMSKLLAAAWVPAEIGLLLFFALVAFFGGGIRAAIRRDPRRPMIDVLLQAAASGFCGLIIGAVGVHLWGTDRVYLLLALVGVAGWVGTVLLDMAGDRLVAYTHRRLDQEAGEAPPPDPFND